MSIRRYFVKVMVIISVWICAPLAAQAQSSLEDFYRGKNIQLISGSNVGGGCDLPPEIIDKVRRAMELQ
jgi:hypothetical protein